MTFSRGQTDPYLLQLHNTKVKNLTQKYPATSICKPKTQGLHEKGCVYTAPPNLYYTTPKDNALSPITLGAQNTVFAD